MLQEYFQHDGRRDLAQALLRDRGGRKLGVLRRCCQVDPDTGNQKARPVERSHFRFEQDAGDLATVEQHIVRPFIGQATEPRKNLSERAADRDSRDKPELRCPVGRAVGPHQKRHIEIAARRYPGPPAAPPAGGLLERPDHGPGCRSFAGEALGLVIGAADRIIADEPVAQRNPGSERIIGQRAPKPPLRRLPSPAREAGRRTM